MLQWVVRTFNEIKEPVMDAVIGVGLVESNNRSSLIPGGDTV